MEHKWPHPICHGVNLVHNEFNRIKIYASFDSHLIFMVGRDTSSKFTVVVKKNFTFLKTPFPLHGVKTVVLGTYCCRTILENYRRLIITFMCQRNERCF